MTNLRFLRSVQRLSLVCVLAVATVAAVAPATAATKVTNASAEKAVRAWWVKADAAFQARNVAAADRLYIGQSALKVSADFEQNPNLGEPLNDSVTRRPKTLETYLVPGAPDRFIATWLQRRIATQATDDAGKPVSSKEFRVQEFVKTGPKDPWRARLAGSVPSSLKLDIASDNGTLAEVPKPSTLAVAPRKIVTAVEAAVVQGDESAFATSSLSIIEELRGSSIDAAASTSKTVADAIDAAPLVVPLRGGGAFVVVPFDIVSTVTAASGSALTFGAKSAQRFGVLESTPYNELIFATIVELTVIDPPAPKKKGVGPVPLRAVTYVSIATLRSSGLVGAGGS